MAQALCAIGALLAVVSTFVSIAFIVLVQLNFAIGPRIRRTAELRGGSSP